MALPELVTAMVCVAVLWLTGLGLVGGLGRQRRVVSAVRALQQRIHGLPGWSEHPREALAQSWATLDQDVRQSAVLGPAWAPFADGVSRGDDGLWAAQAPDVCLLPHRLAGGRWTDAAVGRLAGLAVTLGILGTFAGLTLGLFAADFAGIAALSDPSARTPALQEAMFGLLAGSSTAFVTSVVGLLGGLTLNGAVRVRGALAVREAVDALCATLVVGVRTGRERRQDAGVEGIFERMVELIRQPAPADPALLAKLDTLASPAPVDPVLLAKLDALATPAAVDPALLARLEALASPTPADPALLARLDALSPASPSHDDLGPRLDALLAAVQAIAAQPRATDPALLHTLSELTASLATPAAPSPPPEVSVPPALTARLDALLAQPPAPDPTPAIDRLAEAIAALPHTPAAPAHAPPSSAPQSALDPAVARIEGAAAAQQAAADTLAAAARDLAQRLQTLQQVSAALRTGLAHHTDASTALTAAAASLEATRGPLTRTADQLRLSARAAEASTARLTALESSRADARLVDVLERLAAVLDERA